MGITVMRSYAILLSAIAILVAGCAPNQSSTDHPPTVEDKQRPNFIIILTDDQRYDALGALNPALQTPHMDRLVSEGVHFVNAFVPTSLCSPSRASLLTGLPMRTHGVVDNNSALSEQFDTFPRALQRAGYDTALFGKWHMGGENDAPRPGFNRWVSFAGQGNYYPVSPMGGSSYLNVDGEKVEQQGYITDELTDFAIEWLDGRAQSQQPFMLYLGHKAAHAFFEPAERHVGMYDTLEIADVTPTHEEMKREPMWVQNQRNSWHGVDFPYHASLSLPDYKRDYLETLSAVDESLGRILAWLEMSGKADNTYIIFLSDNGFLFGEHGLIDKRAAFEESMRVPLMIWNPGHIREGAAEIASVSTLDLAPTIIALAGANTDAPLPGRSLAPLLTQADQEWDDEIIYEYFWEFNYPQTPTQYAIRDGRWKYIRLHGVWDTDALYDLENDPGETNNLINDPEHLSVRIDLQERLHAAIERGDGKGEIPFTYKFNQGAVFRSPRGTLASEFPDRWLRDDEAADIFEHAIPDGPGKDAALEQINEALARQRKTRADRTDAAE